MEQIQNNNASRAPLEARPSSGYNNTEAVTPNNQPRPQLTRVDSRSAFPPQIPRTSVPQQQQQRPQFQPGGPVSNPPFGPRSGPTTQTNQRGPAPVGVPGSPQIRAQLPPFRPPAPIGQSTLGPRPLQSPTGNPPPRGPIPNNLQFGPRQPQQGIATTPDGIKPQVNLQLNGTQNPVLNSGNAQITKQPLQASFKSIEPTNSTNNKSIVNLENENGPNDKPQTVRPDNIMEISGANKGRSFSIAAAPGLPHPFRIEDDRRKSISYAGGGGGRSEELMDRSAGLGLIEEARNSIDNIRGSQESVRQEASRDENRHAVDRSESRTATEKTTDAIVKSLPYLEPKKKRDDDDVVMIPNIQSLLVKQQENKAELCDRSPSLTRSDESPEPKNVAPAMVASNKPETVVPEPQRPKTPKVAEPQRPKTPKEERAEAKEPKPVQIPHPIAQNQLTEAKQPITDRTSPIPVATKPTQLKTTSTPTDSKKSTPRKSHSAPKSKPKDGDNDSGVDESTQGNDTNGSPSSPTKRLPSKLPTKEKSSNSLKQSLSRSSSKSATAKTPENPLPNEKKKVPMNKIQVGGAPSPNIKAVKSKIGSLDNTTYKPGGGKVKIENRKLDFNNITPKIAAKNDAYTPSGGAKKITTTKLEWNAKSKIGSLQNTAYKPGGGDKKIETVKLDFKEKAKPKVASTVNITHKPGGGDVKIENQKLDFKAQSKVGSLDNVKHKPGGGEIKIFDDKEYLKQVGGQSPLPISSEHSRQEDYTSLQEWARAELPLSRSRSARVRTPRTPRTPRALSPQKQPPHTAREAARTDRRMSLRPASARVPHRATCSRRSSISQRPAFTVY